MARDCSTFDGIGVGVAACSSCCINEHSTDDGNRSSCWNLARVAWPIHPVYSHHVLALWLVVSHEAVLTGGAVYQWCTGLCRLLCFVQSQYICQDTRIHHLV